MSKKIKFPLEMANEVKVRTLEELRENFDLEKVLAYYVDGKLLTWLNDRYYENEAQQISQLDSSSSDFKNKLCEILGVDIRVECEIDFEVIERRNAKLAKLKQFTADAEIVKNVDRVAFDQEEMSDLLDDEISPIYLCGEKFIIPLSRVNITYIGVNSPMAVINSKEIVDFAAKGITFQNIKFDEKYRIVSKVDISQNVITKGSSLDIKKELDEIVSKYKDFVLEEMKVYIREDFDLDIDYDWNYRFKSSSEAREAASNRIDMVCEDAQGHFDKKYGCCLSTPLGEKYSKQIIDILKKFKEDIEQIFHKNDIKTPEIKISGSAAKNTVYKEDDPSWVYIIFGDSQDMDEDIFMYNLRNLIEYKIIWFYTKNLKRSDISIEINCTTVWEESFWGGETECKRYNYHLNLHDFKDKFEKEADIFAKNAFESGIIQDYFSSLKESILKDFNEKFNQKFLDRICTQSDINACGGELTDLDIFKQLPQTDCKECGSLTCLAFAKGLANKWVTLDMCPHASEAAKEALGFNTK